MFLPAVDVDGEGWGHHGEVPRNHVRMRVWMLRHEDLAAVLLLELAPQGGQQRSVLLSAASTSFHT